MLYVAVALYVSMAHWAEAEGLKVVCKVLAEETRTKAKARRIVDYLVPVSARIVATVAVAVAFGRIVKEG